MNCPAWRGARNYERGDFPHIPNPLNYNCTHCHQRLMLINDGANQQDWITRYTITEWP